MNVHSAPHRFRTKAIKRAALIGVCVAALVGAVVGGQSGLDRLRDGEVDGVPESETNVTAAEVRDLTETFTASGTLRYDDPIEIAAPTDGTVLHVVGTGTSLDNGDVIAVVDDRSVVWLEGEVPAWRALSVGDEGVDVLQLEHALTALGFNGDNDVTIDEQYTAATAGMVEEWQGSTGVEPTGRVEFGSIVFGGARSRVASVAVAVGDEVSTGTAVIALGTNSRFALLDAVPDQAVTLAVGAPAAIELPDRSELSGTIAAIDPDSETWQVTVRFADAVEFPATDVTNVDMSWTHDIATAVLTVPSSALLRLDNGTYTVAVVDADGSTTATPVTIGSAVGTRVEILTGLHQGDEVVSL